MKGEHVRRDNIKALLTARLTIELNHGQHFCETVKEYEIWESRNGLEYRVKCISKSRCGGWLKNEYDLELRPRPLYGKSGLAWHLAEDPGRRKAFQKNASSKKTGGQRHIRRRV